MALNIIRRRLAKALALQGEHSAYSQYRNPNRKRKASFTRGTKKMTARMDFWCEPELLERLSNLCEKYAVQKGVVIRDALDFYLEIAEREFEDIGPLTGLDALPPILPPGQIRRPDGVIVTVSNINHQAKKK